VTRCGDNLLEVISGRESALEMLFPDGSSEIADGLYNTSPLSRYSNGIVRAAVVAAASPLAQDRPVRILEIGAGTGGTTAALLPAIAHLPVSYCFTDVGPLFLAKARERFATYSFVSYRALDIERSPSAQGFGAHEFDVVVASNVLHATRNLHDTLAHVADLLTPAGLLVLCEATTHPFWFDVTTGLISGWQRFEDDLRDDVPLLAPDAWQHALAGHAFDAVRAYPEPGSPAQVLRQHVFVARRGAARAIQESTTRLEAEPAAAALPARPVAAEPSLESLAALPPSERHERLVALVRDALVRVAGLDNARPPGRDQRLMELGVDSLMALELRTRSRASCRRRLSTITRRSRRSRVSWTPACPSIAATYGVLTWPPPPLACGRQKTRFPSRHSSRCRTTMQRHSSTRGSRLSEIFRTN
jgi:SAM-dependent methyltransferase